MNEQLTVRELLLATLCKADKLQDLQTTATTKNLARQVLNGVSIALGSVAESDYLRTTEYNNIVFCDGEPISPNMGDMLLDPATAETVQDYLQTVCNDKVFTIEQCQVIEQPNEQNLRVLS